MEKYTIVFSIWCARFYTMEAYVHHVTTENIEETLATDYAGYVTTVFKGHLEEF